jgi:Flp pilus assembly protein TadG
MLSLPLARPRAERRAVAAVELALLLPFLAFMFIIVVDWARIFYYSIAVTNCARNGAMYKARQQSATTTDGTYTDDGLINLYLNASPDPVTAAALADASDLSPTPTVSSTTGSDTYGSYVEVTVSYPFQTVANFAFLNFLVPSSTNVTSTCRMYVPPEVPNSVSNSNN